MAQRDRASVGTRGYDSFQDVWRDGSDRHGCGRDAIRTVSGEDSMLFLHHADPRFLEGLRRHGFPSDHGLRLLNTGFVTTPFGQRWTGSAALAQATASGRPFHIDRITGGMPFQSLDGLQPIARGLKDDPHFLGFQAHEWDNSPIHDHRRIHKLFLDQGLAFDEAHFAQYAGRTSLPYFSGGNYATYRDLFHPLESPADLERYYEAYFRKLIATTAGQILSVNGYGQFHHAALRLGARNVMAEIGNQVPLTALQLACARGAARQCHKPFGVYYETWGGAPFGCTCTTRFSPWFADEQQLKAFHDMGSVGPQFGSSRSLQRRLLYFSWLSGAAWWSEEWGAENYFADWDSFPLTEYGRVASQFAQATRGVGPISPIIPAALVLPPEIWGVDVGYLAGSRSRLSGQVEPTPFHARLRQFVQSVYATQPARPGGDAHNLTPSPWIGCFDVLSADAPPALREDYAVTVCFDPSQATDAGRGGRRSFLYTGGDDQIGSCLAAVAESLPFRVRGEVGGAQARTADAILIGLFNNLGVTKSPGREELDPACTRQVTIEGSCAGLSWVCGADCLRRAEERSVTLELPPGGVAVISFPRSRGAADAGSAGRLRD